MVGPHAGVEKLGSVCRSGEARALCRSGEIGALCRSGDDEAL